VSTPRVLFIHGQESGPQGTKAQLLAERFTASTPQMDTRDFEACVARQAEAIRRFRPDVLVGSSFGGAVAVALLQRGLWRGPTLLLAQAAEQLGLRPELPTGVRVWIVHGTRDDVVPVAASGVLAQSGSPGFVRLVEVDDDHRLSASVADGRLVEWVRELARESGEGASGLDRHLNVWVEEPMLWPVALSTALILASVLAWGLLTALRTRNPVVLLAVSALAVASLEVVRRNWRGTRLLAVAVVVVWALTGVIAAVAGHFGVF
jgi:hypothetical protein